MKHLEIADFIYSNPEDIAARIVNKIEEAKRETTRESQEIKMTTKATEAEVKLIKVKMETELQTVQQIQVDTRRTEAEIKALREVLMLEQDERNAYSAYVKNQFAKLNGNKDLKSLHTGVFTRDGG